MSEEAFIYEAIRTPRGKQRGGALTEVKPLNLVVGQLNLVARHGGGERSLGRFHATKFLKTRAWPGAQSASRIASAQATLGYITQSGGRASAGRSRGSLQCHGSCLAATGPKAIASDGVTR